MNLIEIEVNKEVNTIRDSYIASVHRLNSDNGTAASFSKDYAGRQIYELLQNAEDQVINGKGEVKIELSGNKLTVSNTGEPFSAKGFISILYVCDSPKEHVSAKTIGYKGIGFRSVLNWSDKIKITSAGLKLVFSKQNAEDAYYSILNEVEDRVEYEKNYKATETSKIPILVCPKIDSAPQKINGYDTVIEFTCFESIIDNVKEQINELKPEVLLFLKKLKKIEFNIDGEKKQFTRDDHVKSKKVLITDYFGKKEKNIREYDYFAEEGKINDKYFEICIGYDRKTKLSGEVLYSYFKTNVDISFPAFIHATFELSSNRNELLSDNSYNEELTKKLASKLAETAVKISLLDSQKNQATYEPLKLLLTSSIDNSLKQYGFESLIKNEIQSSPIFPTIQNTYISLKDVPLYSENRFDEVLFPESFSNLLKHCDDDVIQKFIRTEANLSFYENSFFKDMLNNDIIQKRYSCEQKCRLIQLIINESPSISGEGITLLEDLQGNIIQSDENVYVSPSAKEKLEIPKWDWLKVKFLNEKMKSILLADVEQDAIDRIFRDFNLVRYRFNTLIGKIISDLNKNKSKENVNVVLKWLFNFYCTPKSENEETGERDLGTTRIPVLCRDNKISFATEAYFGKEYENEIGERIISSYDKEHFLAFDMFNASDKQIVIQFYEWLGVSFYPRIVEHSVEKTDRASYTNYNFYSTNRIYLGSYNKASFNSNFIISLKVFFFEHFEEIFHKREFYEIICWLLNDTKAQECINSTYEVFKQSVMIYKNPRERYERNITSDSLASYILFYLKTKKWIKIGNEFFDAAHCCLEEIKVKGVIECPKIDIKEVQKYCPEVSLSEVYELLRKIGISESFSDLKTNIKYELLLKLPELDKECKYGKAIYNKMKGTADKVLVEKGENYQKFISEGKVLVTINGEKKYVPIKEAKYTPNKLFSEKILNEFPMLAYDYRQGRVQDLFGVELLGDIYPTVTDEKINQNVNKQFVSNFDEFKVYILASRLITNDSDTDLRKLNRLNIILANSLKVNFPINNEVKSVVLDDFQTVYLNEFNDTKTKMAYIKIPNNCSLYTEIENNPYFADAVAEIVSTVLDLSNDLSFFSSLFSSSHERRKNILVNTKGEEVLDYIELAKDKLKIIFDSKQEFWLSIANTKNIHIPDNTSLVDVIKELGISSEWEGKINYEQLNKIESISVVIELFNLLEIDIEDYNKQTADKIYLSECITSENLKS